MTTQTRAQAAFELGVQLHEQVFTALGITNQMRDAYCSGDAATAIGAMLPLGKMLTDALALYDAMLVLHRQGVQS